MITLRLYKILKQIIYKINILNKNKIEIVKLWGNASPTSVFAAQTINLDLSDYSAVLIYSRINKNTHAGGDASATDGGSMYTTYLKIGTGTYINLAHSLWNGTVSPGFATRNAWAMTTGVGFSEGYWHSQGTSGEASNNYVIPVEIYGIKGVQ